MEVKSLTTFGLLKEAGVASTSRNLLKRFWLYFILMILFIVSATLISTYTDIYLFEPHLSFDPLEFYFVSRASEMFVEIFTAPFVGALFALAIAFLNEKPLSSVSLFSFFRFGVWSQLVAYRVLTILLTNAVGIFVGVLMCLFQEGFSPVVIPFTLEFLESSNTINFIAIAIEFMFILSTPLITHHQLNFTVAMSRSAKIMAKNFYPAATSICMLSFVILCASVPLIIDYLNHNNIIHWFNSAGMDFGIKIMGGSMLGLTAIWFLPMMYFVLARVFLNENDQISGLQQG